MKCNYNPSIFYLLSNNRNLDILHTQVFLEVIYEQILTGRSKVIDLTARFYCIFEEPNVIKYGTNQSNKEVDG